MQWRPDIDRQILRAAILKSLFAPFRQFFHVCPSPDVLDRRGI
jgi:hypothetical protein